MPRPKSRGLQEGAHRPARPGTPRQGNGAGLLDLYDVPASPNAFTVRPATFVTTEDGTGIVHMAPAYGEDDASVGRRDALPVLHPVDAAGRFTAGPRAALVAGKFVKDADKDVLKQREKEARAQAKASEGEG